MIAVNRAFADAMRSFGSGAAYLNFTPEGDRVQDGYGEAKYQRLVALKDAYDRDNLFRLNPNVRPTGATPERGYAGQDDESPNPLDGADIPAEIESYEGPRQALRHLFELADDSARQIESYLEAGRVLVARVDGAIVGHALLLPGDQPDLVDLKSIADLEALQGRGVGRALVRHAVAACRRDGVRILTVTTATADIENIRFYQRSGFRACAIERDVFTEADGYPPDLIANGIPVRDGITFSLAIAPDDPDA